MRIAMPSKIGGVLFLLVSMLWTASATAKTQRIAVIVGNNIGLEKEEPLRYAEKEAMEIYEMLLDIGGVRPNNAYLLVGKSARDARAVFDEVRRRIVDIRRDGDVLLIFYYSGHASEQALHLADTRFGLDRLKSFLSRTNATTTIAVVDSCKSGALTRTKGVKVLPAYDVAIEEPGEAKGQIFITSSGASEVSIEDEGLKGSVFSHYFISGMRGDADVDKDGRIDLDELYKYTYHSTVAKTVETPVGSQHPRFDYDLRGAGSLILSWPKKSEARLTIGPGASGTFLIASKYKRRVLAEVNLQKHETKTMALPAQRYIVKQRAKGGFRVGEVNLTWGGTKQLDVSKMHHVRYEPIAHKGTLPTTSIYSSAAGFRVRNGIVDGNKVLFGPTVGVRRRFTKDWLIGMDFGLVLGNTQTQDFSVGTRGLSIELGAVYARDMGRLQIGVGGFTGPTFYWQEVPNQGTRGAIGATGGLLSTLIGTVADPITVGLTLRAGMEYTKRTEGYGVGAHASAELGIGLRF